MTVVNSKYCIAEKCEVVDYVECESSTGQSVYRLFTTEKNAHKASKKSFAELVEKYKGKTRTLRGPS